MLNEKAVALHQGPELAKCGLCEFVDGLCEEHDEGPVSAVQRTHTQVRVGLAREYVGNHWVACAGCSEDGETNSVSDDCSIYEDQAGEWHYVCMWCEGTKEGGR